MKNTTIQYYDTHVKDFTKDTQQVNFTSLQDRFLQYLPKGSHILDLGCGAGRDSHYFIQQGYQVTAVDGSLAMCKTASSYIGQPVIHATFDEFTTTDKFHGIWACASLLHVPGNELPSIIKKLATMLVPEGYLYLSFKYGEYSGIRNNRYFTDMTPERLKQLMNKCSDLKCVEVFLTGDVREGRNEERWVNGIYKNTAIQVVKSYIR